MKIDLSKYEIPEIVEKDNKLQIYDKLKGIYRVVSPNQKSEEYVRQKVIEYLKHELKITYESIDIEESEAHYHDNNQRMDLLVSGMSDKKELLMVVECKAETVKLTEDVYDQVKGYAERLNIPVLMVTNGLEADFLKRDENNNYEQIIKPPTYNDLLDYNNIKTEPILEYSYDRYTYEELFDEKIHEQEINIDEDNRSIHDMTRKELIPYILNFRDCLLDTSHKIDDLSLGKFNFVEDLGVFYRKVDNTGGKFINNFRSLSVEIDGNIEIIDLLITPYFTNSGRSDTVMMVALNQAEILWVRFDRFGVLENKTLKLYDDGSASTRNMGPIKREIILNYIRENSNIKINEDNMIEFGEINMSDLIYADNSEFKNVLGTIIEYALLKQERREEYQKNYVPKPKIDKQLPVGVQKNHINKIIKKIGVKEIDEDAMELLNNHLNEFSIEILDEAAKEAEKLNHRNISPFDFLRVLYRLSNSPEKYNNKVTIFGEEYESIFDYIKKNFFILPVEVVLWEDEVRQIADEHDYEGIYTFILEYPSSEQICYYFVCTGSFEEDNESWLEFVPVYLPDVEIFKYFDDNDQKLYGEYTVEYLPYSSSNYQTQTNELVDFVGNIRSIKSDELYVTENEINYLVNSKSSNTIVKTKHVLKDMEVLDQMEQDNFEGLYCEEYIYNTGEYAIEDYYVTNVDAENVYLEKNSDIERTGEAIPSFILYDENDENKGYMMVKRFLRANYISSEELNELS